MNYKEVFQECIRSSGFLFVFVLGIAESICTRKSENIGVEDENSMGLELIHLSYISRAVHLLIKKKMGSMGSEDMREKMNFEELQGAASQT